MIRVLARGALTSAALLLLIACGATAPPESLSMGQPAQPGQAEPTEAAQARPSGGATARTPAAMGIRITGNAYAFHAPHGWQDISRQLTRRGQEVDTGVGEDLGQATTVRENVAVAVDPIPGVSLDTYEQSAPRSLAYLIDDLEIYDRVVIDGREAVHVGGEANSGEASFIFEQFAVVRGETMYTVSFALDEGRPETDRRKLIDSVLASWEWQT